MKKIPEPEEEEENESETDHKFVGISNFCGS